MTDDTTRRIGYSRIDGDGTHCRGSQCKVTAHERILRPVSQLDVIRITILGNAKRVTAAETQLIVA